MKNCENLNISLPAEYWERLKKRRESRGVSVSKQIKIALQKFWEDEVNG